MSTTTLLATTSAATSCRGKAMTPISKTTIYAAAPTVLAAAVAVTTAAAAISTTAVALSAAEHIAAGQYGQAEVLLLKSYTCSLERGCDVDIIRALVRLGDLYRAQFRWANAAGKYHEAYALWEQVSYSIHDPSVHPITFLPSLVECCEKLGGETGKMAAVIRAKALAIQEHTTRGLDDIVEEDEDEE
ncbi:hypothetical protein EXIGLDRAFT_761756 [Exidia glandulosa HHB12029]|uniref:TPR-like protein n=1 Tax=Exidia glandulosa HHB12029 TaxID=1314781 RepID=A0A165N9A1_EXIGL|nr:hypothetical protein EXIGLDRAFT_761756 [Exidia glandulosa HHB12029]